MLDQGGCGYNNFEYVSVAKLKEVEDARSYAGLVVSSIEQKRQNNTCDSALILRCHFWFLFHCL